MHNYTAWGADTTNDFAEETPPKAPLYAKIDSQFKAWWEKILKQPPTTVDHILPVRHVLQGHPESTCLWATMIHPILTASNLGFKSAKHEPCLYKGKLDGTTVFMRRQVDDFTVAAPSLETANKLFHLIHQDLKQPLKLLGVLTMFNGLDVLQGNRYIKISCATCIQKNSRRTRLAKTYAYLSYLHPYES